MDGRLRAVGRRGGVGTLLFTRAELDRFARGDPRLPWRRIVRVRLPRELHMDKTTKWIRQWNCWVAPTKPPGVWKRKEGGHLVRARVTDPTTGCKKEIRKVLPEATEAVAYQWLTDERTRVRAVVLSVVPPKTRFAEFAALLFERKVATREIKSARSRERWKHTLEHLIAGTQDVPGFGEMFVDQMQAAHVLVWKTGMAKLIAAGHHSPVAANGWMAILRVIVKAAKRELGLPSDATEGVSYFDTSEHATYAEEEPNALPPDKAGEFLACMREVYPEHHAMTFLGFATGLRPSSMRPLRRKGTAPDVRWEEGVSLVRRSHSLGDEVMDTTKTKLPRLRHEPRPAPASASACPPTSSRCSPNTCERSSPRPSRSPPTCSSRQRTAVSWPNIACEGRSPRWARSSAWRCAPRRGVYAARSTIWHARRTSRCSSRRASRVTSPTACASITRRSVPASSARASAWSSVS
jgi:hypothetical protein